MTTNKFKKNFLVPPIAFIIFNRPNYTQKVFNEIKKAQPKKLFVIADGPRNIQESIICEETRKIIDQVDWNCEVYKNYSDKNLGCKIRVSSGIDWFFENVESGIILEDDCLPQQSFFRFSSEMLEKYKDDNTIMMITGSNSLDEFKIKDSYTFSRYFAIWGWATWKRAWVQYDREMKRWPEYKKGGLLKNIYSQGYMTRHITRLFDQSYRNETDTWDTQWFYTCLFNRGLSVVPAVNLISNIGIDGTRMPGNNQNIKTYDLYEKGITHPTKKEENILYDNALYEKNYNNQPSILSFFLSNIWSKLYRTLRQFEILRKIYGMYIRTNTYINGYGTYENVNHTHYQKNCLLLYIVEPFKSKNRNYQHQNQWQAKEIARIVGEYGYNVDVVNFNDKKVKLGKNYDLIIDLHPNPTNIYNGNLNSKAKKIAYITGSNPSFSNKAEKTRLDEIYRTKGVRLKAKRSVGAFDKKYLESFNSVFIIGNEQTASTYESFDLPSIYLIPNTGYTFLNNYDFSEKSPKNFLFLSGGGQVHKGLHLLLDIFLKNKDLHLYVCSGFESEKDFCKLYQKELFETPNIHPIGLVDITGPEFKEITARCSYIISPSCSEGMSGAVLTGMSCGLLPIVSRESGFVNDTANILKNCDIDYLAQTIRELSSKPMDWILAESKKVIDIANTRFNETTFTKSIEVGLSDVVDNK